MNGLSLTSVLSGTATSQSIGTLSAKPETMFADSLPFRLQLEASTAPHAIAGTIPALKGEERFVMPQPTDETFDRFAPRAADERDRGDAQSSDDRRETPDAQIAALLPMIATPDYFVPSPGAIGTNPDRGIANVAPAAVDSRPFGASKYTLQWSSAATNDRVTDRLDRSPVPDADPDLDPLVATDPASHGSAASALPQATLAAPIANPIPTTLATSPTTTASAGAHPSFADNQPMADGSRLHTATSAAVIGDTAAPQPSNDVPATAMPGPVPQGTGAGPIATAVSEPAPEAQVKTAPTVSRPAMAAPQIPMAATVATHRAIPSDSTEEAPLPYDARNSAPPATVSVSSEASPADPRLAAEARGEQRAPTNTTQSAETAQLLGQEIPGNQATRPVAAPLRAAPGTDPAQMRNTLPDAYATTIATPPHDAARADRTAARSVIGIPVGERPAPAATEALAASAAPAVPARSAETAELKMTMDRLPRSRIEAGTQRESLDALAPSRPHTPLAPRPTPMLAADLVVSPTQHFAQVTATQNQMPSASEPAQPTLPSSANIPFDQNFGQRVGAAIGAAMNAMSIKNGMLLLQISPERLGKIEIEIDSKMERLQITTDNEAVRGAIAQAHGRIEQELRLVGQRIATIDVETRDAAGSQLNNGAADQRGGQNSGQQPVPGRHDPRTRLHDQGASHPGHPDAPRPSSNVLYA